MKMMQVYKTTGEVTQYIEKCHRAPVKILFILQIQ